MNSGRIGRLFVPCRGLAASRIVEATHEAGFEVVVGVAAEDLDAGWHSEADFSMLLPGLTVGDIPSAEAIVAACVDAGCDAVHPGWGPLARSAELAQTLGLVGIGYVGSSPDQLRFVNDRVGTRKLAEAMGIPVVPGSEPIASLGQAESWIAWTGMPVVGKRTTGRGKRSSTVLEDRDLALRFVEESLQRVSDQGDEPPFLERLVVGARDVSVPIIGEGDGDVFSLSILETTINFIGRRAISEAPAGNLTNESFDEMQEAAMALASHMEWKGLGSVRFLVTPDGRPYFLQLRAGMQACHSAIESVLGVDLLDAQYRLGMGEYLGWEEGVVDTEDFAIGIAVHALPDAAVGKISSIEVPESDKIRSTFGFFEGDMVLPGDHLGEIVVQGNDRQNCIANAQEALAQVKIAGVEHDLAMSQRLFGLSEYRHAPLNRDQVAEQFSLD